MLSRNLLIRPISAKLLHDTEFIGKMSPYLRVTAGAEILKSPACHKGHLTPTWDTELIMALPELCNSILLELFNKETLSKDDFIGSARFDLNQLTEGGFRGWIPLSYAKGDAGTLFIEINFMNPDVNFNKGMPTGFVSHQPIFNKTETLSTAHTSTVQANVFNTQNLVNPIIHKEDAVYTKEQPFIVRERPIVHEKTIITEKPIITEKDILTCEQPIIIEKPELVERHFYQQAAPVVRRDEATMRTELEGQILENAELYGTPIVDRATEFKQAMPVYNREIADVYEQKLVTEKPIIHQKDIYHVEKPIFIERPEIVQKPIFQTGPVITETFQPVLKTEVTKEAINIEGESKVHSDVKVVRHGPIVEFERPEVFEKEVIHEQAIIHEQPIINVEKQIIQEKPEYHERRIYHQEPVKVVQEQPIIREEQSRP
jgi:hypothetical protein